MADVMEYVGVVHSDAMRCVRAVKSKQQSTTRGIMINEKHVYNMYMGQKGSGKNQYNNKNICQRAIMGEQRTFTYCQ